MSATQAAKYAALFSFVSQEYFGEETIRFETFVLRWLIELLWHRKEGRPAVNLLKKSLPLRSLMPLLSGSAVQYLHISQDVADGLNY